MLHKALPHLFVSGLLSLLVSDWTLARPPVEEPSLAVLLERLDRVASLYHDRALDFTCVETVDYSRRRIKYDYIYKVDNDGVLHDHHVPKVWGGRSKMLQRPKGVPDGIARPSLWTGVFSRVRQRFNRYEITGRETVLGRSAIKIFFEPIPGGPIIRQVNDWVGTAWIDDETAQVLKVVAYSAQEYNVYILLRRRYEQAKPRQKKPRKHAVTTYSSWFGYETSGMRFPTEVRSERRRYLVPGDDLDDPRSGHRVFLVRQTYDRYRFFGIRTEEQVTGVVLGESP